MTAEEISLPLIFNTPSFNTSNPIIVILTKKVKLFVYFLADFSRYLFKGVLDFQMI